MLGTGKLMHAVPDTIKCSHNRDGAIVLDIKRGQIFNLNPVGSRILELLRNGSPESQIVDCVASEFKASRNLVESDVREFMQVLRDQRLIEEQNSNKRS